MGGAICPDARWSSVFGRKFHVPIPHGWSHLPGPEEPSDVFAALVGSDPSWVEPSARTHPTPLGSGGRLRSDPSWVEPSARTGKPRAVAVHAVQFRSLMGGAICPDAQSQVVYFRDDEVFRSLMGGAICPDQGMQFGCGEGRFVPIPHGWSHLPGLVAVLKIGIKEISSDPSWVEPSARTRQLGCGIPDLETFRSLMGGAICPDAAGGGTVFQ